MPDDENVDTDLAAQEGSDLDSIKDFEGSTIDDPTTPHVQESTKKAKEKPKEKPEDKVEDQPSDDENIGEEDEDFEKEYDDISKVWSRPTVKSITAKHPNIFKDFPELRTIMFREGKFTEMYPTLEEASDVLLAKEELDEINARINNGDVAAMFEDIDKAALPKLVANFLPALYKSNQDLYYRILNPIFDNVLKAAYREGETNKDDNLKWSAAHLSKFIFRDESFASGEKTIPRLEFKEDKDLTDERAKFKAEKFAEARESVVSHSEKRMEVEIKNGLPKDISPRLQSIIADQIIKKIDSTLAKDSQHLNFMKRLWGQAEKGNFSGEHKARISSAYLARARNMIPKFRDEIVLELIGKEDETSENGSKRRLTPSGGPPTSSGRQQVQSKDVVYERSSDMDIIKGKATLKNR